MVKSDTFDFFRTLWILIWQWMCIILVNPLSLVDHSFHFSVLSSFSKSNQNVLHVVWLTCV